jgi:gluconate 5-dehydrogenase
MSDPLFEVAGQVVLVSGGSRGIGRAIAEGFAARGAKVFITGRDTSTLAQTAREISIGVHPVHPVVCDICDAGAIRTMIATVLAETGRIDTLVNVAGVNRRKPALSITDEDYDHILDTNLRGVFILSREVGRGMVERGSGCQINIASLTSDRPLKNVAPYAISKAGLVSMTRALALEWGGAGVRVNGLAPGFILTDLTEKLWSDPTMQAWGEANTPMRRLGQPSDMVGTAIFLASPAAAFMTGQTLYVDGGFVAGVSWPIG